MDVKLGKHLFSFRDKSEWVNKASSWFQQSGYLSGETLCIDQKGRVCRLGYHFDIADIEHAYPIDVFVIREDEALDRRADERSQNYLRRRVGGKVASG